VGEDLRDENDCVGRAFCDGGSGEGYWRLRRTVCGDEGEAGGGKNKGFNPYELLLASLGACTCATVRMYADKKGMNLDETKVNLSLERNEEKNITNITRDIKFIGELTEEELAKLLAIANKCPVHKILSNPIQISTQMV